MFKLIEAKTNVELMFTFVNGGQGAEQRLMDLGLIPGERLKILNNPGHGPVTVLIKGAKVALGHGLAEKIMVEER